MRSAQNTAFSSANRPTHAIHTTVSRLFLRWLLCPWPSGLAVWRGAHLKRRPQSGVLHLVNTSRTDCSLAAMPPPKPGPRSLDRLHTIQRPVCVSLSPASLSKGPKDSRRYVMPLQPRSSGVLSAGSFPYLSWSTCRQALLPPQKKKHTSYEGGIGARGFPVTWSWERERRGGSKEMEGLNHTDRQLY